MVKIKDSIGKEHECLYLIEFMNWQPKTKEMMFSVMAVGYDGIRRSVLFTYFDEQEMHKKYEELREEHTRKRKEELFFDG